MIMRNNPVSTTLPFCCRILDPRKLVKGMTVVVLDETKKSVQDIKYFDFTKNDKEFQGFMIYVPDHRVVFFATYGDVAEK